MNPTILEKKNKHIRDSHIKFAEKSHIYTIDGDSSYLSVTKWIHSLFPKFNPDEVIKKMMSSDNWKNSEYYGMTPREIKQKWMNNGKQASEDGTKMHFDIECFYNDLDVEIDENCLEWKYFEEFENDIGSKLKPYRTEWMIYDKELHFAGSVDMLFENDDGTLQIYDWKRCKEIKKENKWESSNTECISHLPNCNFWHYSLQLNTYKWILEKNYGKKVTNMCLVCLHPNNKNKSYLKYEVPDMSDEINNLMNLRKDMLKQKSNSA